jgi:hypothetical protein
MELNDLIFDLFERAFRRRPAEIKKVNNGFEIIDKNGRLIAGQIGVRVSSLEEGCLICVYDWVSRRQPVKSTSLPLSASIDASHDSIPTKFLGSRGVDSQSLARIKRGVQLGKGLDDLIVESKDISIDSILEMEEE